MEKCGDVMQNENIFDEEFLDESDYDIEFDASAVSAEPYFDYDGKRKSCVFTGHRFLTTSEKHALLSTLKSTILYLISQGVKDFHCGAALGFDTLAAAMVYDVSREHGDIRLILDIPYENQTEKWGEKDRRHYEFIKSVAHETVIHSGNPKNKDDATKALLARNRAMVDKSHYCVCYLKDTAAKRGGTAYTVNYAKLHDLQIINLAE